MERSPVGTAGTLTRLERLERMEQFPGWNDWNGWNSSRGGTAKPDNLSSFFQKKQVTKAGKVICFIYGSLYIY